MLKGLILEKDDQKLSSKMTTNSQLSKSEHIKQKQKQTKQTTRTGIESEKWTSHGGISVGIGKGGMGGKGTGKKKHKW